ncbi:MAG: hypothetical protein H0V14_12905 [Chitinophagaceae bacterium]|nr:hypothetical protein [Chitinophagaceae bacterium]
MLFANLKFINKNNILRGYYPIGVVLAPIMPVEGQAGRIQGNYPGSYSKGLTFQQTLLLKLITHRFTPGFKEVIRAGP